jgi:hypothetical protein
MANDLMMVIFLKGIISELQQKERQNTRSLIKQKHIGFALAIIGIDYSQ